MLEELKIRVFGHQPVPNISNKTLEKIIQRDYGNYVEDVRQKLKIIKSDSQKEKNRISAAVLKLANGQIDEIDKFTEIYENDFRDVLASAEYPLCSSHGFGEKTKKELRAIFLTDWKSYSKWLEGGA